MMPLPALPSLVAVPVYVVAQVSSWHDNRWPHGYAYEYNSLFDPDWQKGEAPHEIARARFGPITIANSDAAAAAYTDTAIDQGHRAVEELFGY